MKKRNLFLLLLLNTPDFIFAQNTQNCTPLFSSLINHDQKSCDAKEFQELEIYKSAKPANITETKKGEYMKVAYSFTGDWNNRPSPLQIYQNYVSAISKAGGEVLYNGNRGIYGKLKKGGDTYWIKISTDGSGYYYYESIKEAIMRQDVVMSAEEIKTSLASDGKVSFYGIYFDTDKATLKPESAPTITTIAAFLKANPAVKVFVVGHTDNSGNFENNLSLSKDRAIAVINELTTKYAANKNQLAAQGIASLSPIASNNTEEGKSKNRRVEIVRQ